MSGPTNDSGTKIPLFYHKHFLVAPQLKIFVGLP